jgi:hypothetical protein
MRKMKITLSALALIAFAFFTGYIFYIQRGDDLADPLCLLATKEFKMHCSILAAPGVYERGAVVNIPKRETGESKIGFPTQQIFGPSCVMDASNVDFSVFREQPDQSVVFGKKEVAINRSISAGAKLAVPEAANFDLQAGPNISEARSVVLSAESAQIFTIDQNAVQDALNSCNIRASCLRGISGHQGIVKRLLVAKNLQYSVKDKNGAEFPLNIAAEKGLINFGLRAGRDAVSTRDLSSGKDMVFAVDISDASSFNLATCQSSLQIYKVTGRAKAKAVTRDKIQEQEAANDSEVAAHVAYQLPDRERESNESISVGEAFANAKWSFGTPGTKILLDSTVLVIVGQRWPFGTKHQKLTYATSTAATELSVDILLGNRGESAKQLTLILEIEVRKNRGVPPFQHLDDVSVTTRGNIERHITVLWRSNETRKEFSLGQIRGGELARVRLARTLSAVAQHEDNDGKIDELLQLSFELR